MNTLNDHELQVANRNFYEPLWRDARLVEPERFNTWPLISLLAAKATRRLEVAPGLRPRLPGEGTVFVDIKYECVDKTGRLRREAGDGPHRQIALCRRNL